MSRSKVTVLLGLMLAVSLAGCGQKGALYRENPGQKSSLAAADLASSPASNQRALVPVY